MTKKELELLAWKKQFQKELNERYFPSEKKPEEKKPEEKEPKREGLSQDREKADLKPKL